MLQITNVVKNPQISESVFTDSEEEIEYEQSALSQQVVVYDIGLIGWLVCVFVDAAGEKYGRYSRLSKRVLIAHSVENLCEVLAAIKCQVKIHFVVFSSA